VNLPHPEVLAPVATAMTVAAAMVWLDLQKRMLERSGQMTCPACGAPRNWGRCRCLR